MHITHDDVRKLAKMARVEVTDDEIDGFAHQLESVLGYAERVCQVAADIDQEAQSSQNVLRDDVTISSDAQAILEQAPECEDNLFVVPHIMGRSGDL